MRGNDYNIALLMFFVTYIIFEVPSNLVSPHNTARESIPVNTAESSLISESDADHQESATIHLPLDYHESLGHCHHLPRPCQESARSDCPPTAGGHLRSRPLSWLSVPDRVLVQALRTAMAVQPLLLGFDPRWRLQWAASVWYCEHGWSGRLQWLVLDIHPVSRMFNLQPQR